MESSKSPGKGREQVLEAAEACKRLLRERFGAQRVILFGSLAGQDPWHAQKDSLDFRHFFRHAYGYTLEWSQLRWKAEQLSATLTILRDQLHPHPVPSAFRLVGAGPPNRSG